MVLRTNPDQGPNAAAFVAAVAAGIEHDLGSDLESGTTIVPAEDRAGSRTAVSYPLPDRTAIWCDPAIEAILGPLAGPEPLSTDDFLERASTLAAGEVVGRGLDLVLDGELQRPRITPAAQHGIGMVRPLDRDDADDRALISALIADCPDDDCEEAELDIDDLDPGIVAVLDPSGAIVAYAGGRPATHQPEFDDIAVITHPDHRGGGLGALAVYSLIEHQRPTGRRPLYRCDVENVGSKRLAQSLGFTTVFIVGAARWPDDTVDDAQDR